MALAQMDVRIVNSDAQLVVQIVAADDTLLALGNDKDVGLYLRSTTLAADAEITNVIVGTSDHQGVAPNSLIVTNITASGDIGFYVNNGGNSLEALLIDASVPSWHLGYGLTGDGSVYVGTGNSFDVYINKVKEIDYATGALAFQQATTISTTTGNLTLTSPYIADDILLRLGTGGDQVFLNRSTTLAANTALTNVLVGTPVTLALAANSLIISNVAADGNILLAARKDANSVNVLSYDSATRQLRIYNNNTDDTVDIAQGIIFNYAFSLHRFDANIPAPWIALRHMNGTSSAPSATTVDQRFGEISFGGYGAGASPWGLGAELRATATETWTATASGGKFEIETTSTGTRNIFVRTRWENHQVVIGEDAPSITIFTSTAPALQVSGTGAYSGQDSHMSLGRWSASVVAPTFSFVKSRSTTVGGAATVANADGLGEIYWIAADGTDLNTQAAIILATVTGTVAANRVPTSLRFGTAAGVADDDNAERWRISPLGVWTSLAAVPTNVNIDGAIIADGGIAFTDVLNAWIDDASHGTGTTTLYIGNASILVSGGALGTPASGTGTNITGIPAANILAGSFGAGAYVISTSLQAATIELGHATDTTLARVSAGVVSIEGAAILTNNGVSFGPGGVISITVVGGQITAIS